MDLTEQNNSGKEIRILNKKDYPQFYKELNRNERWKPLLINHKGVKYYFYQKVNFENLDRHFKAYLDNGSRSVQEFIKTHAPFYTNLILYVLEEKIRVEKEKGNYDYEYRKMTQKAIIKRIKELFGKYGYRVTQSAVAKALKTLETPFCYDPFDTQILTVGCVKRRNVREHEERYEYWLKPLKEEFYNKASSLRSKFISKVAIPFSYVINQYWKKLGDFEGWIETGFVYRFNNNGDAIKFKTALLESFGEQCFFNIVVYEENVIILLALNNPNLAKVSDVIGNLFDEKFK